MKFEWDEAKNKENIRKHELDFADAWEIFAAPMLAALDAREDYGEDRWIGIGFLRNFIAVVTYAEREEVIRVISLRKALKHERTRFEQALRNELGEGQ
ncbi:MAG TPA: BrnT family toxin [Pyrinomonadaceae bacterium]